MNMDEFLASFPRKFKPIKIPTDKEIKLMPDVMLRKLQFDLTQELNFRKLREIF